MNSWNDTQYVILRKLGEGGMGTVFLAEDTLLKRQVAIKQLNKPDSANIETLDQRFQQEALALARLNHPNITHLYSFLPREGSYWMVMEYLQGESLEQWVQKFGNTTPLVAASIVVQLLDGLNHAHKKGIIHRDLKPANVMISEEGEVKIMDFGIARIQNSQRITQHGKSVGTLQYMAPEQIKGLEGDERTDIYAAGTILFELLAGRPPFRSDTDYQLMKSKLEDNAAGLPASIPSAIQRVILKALNRSPDKRYPNVLALKEAIEQCFDRRLLRENELFNELRKKQAENTKTSIYNATTFQKPFSNVNPQQLISGARSKLKRIPDIDFRTALILLMAVVIICGGLLFWNNYRQQNTAGLSGVEIKDTTANVVDPLPEKDPGIEIPPVVPKGQDPVEITPLSGTQPSSDNSDKNDTAAIRKHNNSVIKGAVKKDSLIAKRTGNASIKDSTTLIKDTKTDETKPPKPPIADTTSALPAEDKGEAKEPVNFGACSGKKFAARDITIILTESLSSEDRIDAKKIIFKCAEDVKLGDCFLIRKGAEVTGRIVAVGKSGKNDRAFIGFYFFDVTLASGKKHPIDDHRKKEYGELGKPLILKEGQSFNVRLANGKI